MDEHGFQFRTAAIGGFQKQDVMAYLERSAKEHAQRLAQLQKQLEEARTARTAGDEQRLAETQRVSELEEENRKLTGDLAERDIDTLDAGVPVLSMHAPFEVTGKLDCYMTYKGMKAVYEHC